MMSRSIFVLIGSYCGYTTNIVRYTHGTVEYFNIFNDFFAILLVVKLGDYLMRPMCGSMHEMQLASLNRNKLEQGAAEYLFLESLPILE